MKNTFLILLFLFCQLSFCQDQKIIHGKIIAKNASTAGIKIINLANERETYSNEKGEFDISAKTEDLLVFSSINMEPYRKLIEKEDFDSNTISIEMIPKITQLDEVKIITHPEFDAVQLGILTKPAKKYTVAERRLKTASEFKPIMLVGFLFGGALPVDPILNAISGRTKLLKKELSVEREESLLTILTETFNDDYYTNELKIEPDHIKGFQYYAIQNKDMAKYLRSKNKAMASLIAVQLAYSYNNLQRDNQSVFEKQDTKKTAN